MQIEKQVVSLELAKRLKELGVKQESYFNWLVASDGARLMKNPVLSTYKYFEQFSAFTVAELGEMLPPEIIVVQNHLSLDIKKIYSDGYWSIGYVLPFKDSVVFRCEREADARAKMLIYLLENNLINKE